jgi:hypothetical protein
MFRDWGFDHLDGEHTIINYIFVIILIKHILIIGKCFQILSINGYGNHYWFWSLKSTRVLFFVDLEHYNNKRGSKIPDRSNLIILFRQLCCYEHYIKFHRISKCCKRYCILEVRHKQLLAKLDFAVLTEHHLPLTFIVAVFCFYS